MENTPPSNGGGLVEDRNARDLWRVAHKKVAVGVTASLAFDTLRDRAGEAYIPESSLTKVKRLGKGAFAVVDLCMLKTQDGRVGPVAVKRLKPDLFQNDGDVKLFLEEAQLLRKLSHSAIVDFIGAGYSTVSVKGRKGKPGLRY